MADPLGIIGAISVAAAAANKLITVVSNIQNAPAEITSLNSHVETLASILESAKSLCEDERLTEAAKPLLDTVEKCVINCEVAIRPLQNELEPLASGWIRSQSMMVRLQWSRKKGNVEVMKTRLGDARDSLGVAVVVLNGYVTGKGQAEILNELTAGFEKLSQNFRHLDTSRTLRKTLEDDLETLVSSGTVAGESKKEMLDRWVDIQASGTADTTAMPLDLDDREISGILAADDAEKVSELLASGVLKLDKSLQSRTILHRCALYDSKHIAEIILGNGAPVDAKDVDRLTPLDICIREQSWGVAAVLINHSCSLKALTTNFFNLLEVDDLASIRPVLRALATRVRGSKDGPFFIHQVVERNEPRILSLLLEEGFDANDSEYGCLPIHVAAALNHAACTSILLQHGADPNAKVPREARDLLRPSIPRHKLILDGMADARTMPLGLCGKRRDTENLRILLEHGADPDIPFPPIGDVFLIPHCATQFTRAAQLVLEAGANPNLQNVKGEFPLFWAVSCHNMKLVNLLLDRGADTELKTNKDYREMTALHRAIECGAFGMAQVLVQRGASLHSRNGRNETPLEMAERKGASNIAEMLRQRINSESQ
ncbi:hypothetical protein EsH8_III_000057 [Colletotrichum jinshuiense]